VEKTGLPPGVVRLLDLATAVPERKGARRELKRDPFLARIGAGAEKAWKSNRDVFTFVGEVSVAVLRMFRGRRGSAGPTCWRSSRSAVPRPSPSSR